MEVLGLKVSRNGASLCEGHIQVIQALVEPASGVELMKKLGLENYFSRFLRHFAELAPPLYQELNGTGSSKKTLWTALCNSRREGIAEASAQNFMNSAEKITQRPWNSCFTST